MATITVSSGSYIRPHSSMGEIVHYREGATQTFKVGDPVIFSSESDGEDMVIIAGSDPGAIVGFAAEAASGVTGTKLPVYTGGQGLANFRVHVADGQTLDVNMLKAAGYGIVADGTNLIWRLDTTETTAKIFKVRKLIDAHGDVNGAVVASILAAERETEV